MLTLSPPPPLALTQPKSSWVTSSEYSYLCSLFQFLLSPEGSAPLPSMDNPERCQRPQFSVLNLDVKTTTVPLPWSAGPRVALPFAPGEQEASGASRQLFPAAPLSSCSPINPHSSSGPQSWVPWVLPPLALQPANSPSRASAPSVCREAQKPPSAGSSPRVSSILRSPSPPPVGACPAALPHPFIFPACWGRCYRRYQRRCRRRPELSAPSARATQPHKPASSPKARSWAGDGGRESLARPCVSGGGGGASRRRASAAASPHVHTGNSPPARRRQPDPPPRYDLSPRPLCAPARRPPLAQPHCRLPLTLPPLLQDLHLSTGLCPLASSFSSHSLRHNLWGLLGRPWR